MFHVNTILTCKSFILVLLMTLLVQDILCLSAKLQPTITSSTQISTVSKLTPPSDCIEHNRRANTSHAISLLREAMKKPTLLHDVAIDAFIVVSTDEHQNEEPSEDDKRLLYATGWFGSGKAIITYDGPNAIWTPSVATAQAKQIVSCDWEVYDLEGSPTLGEWLGRNLPVSARVGADPRLIEYAVWQEMLIDLQQHRLQLVNMRFLFDTVWEANGRPQPSKAVAYNDAPTRSGQDWREKVELLRKELRESGVDAMVVTALDEIGWLLNVRGKDIPYSPLVKCFLIVTGSELHLYISQGKLAPVEVRNSLGSDACYSANCTRIHDYKNIYQDLRTRSQVWKTVLIPSPGVYHRGASEAIVESIPETKRFFKLSPIIYMKAKKNEAEILGMRTAQVRDGAAMCHILHYIEQSMERNNKWNEVDIINQTDLNRRAQINNVGLSRRTIAAFGSNAAIPEYRAIESFAKELHKNTTLIIESGGQYEEGTTILTRTLHFGHPTIEVKRAYTLVLQALIQMSSLVFPSQLPASNLDAIARAPLWDVKKDYVHSTSHGVGAFLNVREDPIDIHYNNIMSMDLLKEGYFLTNEPGYYEPHKFGVRLGNVMQVKAKHSRKNQNDWSYEPSYLAFEDITLVPYEPKLIDVNMLTKYQRKWLNRYNIRIRQTIGKELKQLGQMQAYYWMMNKTLLVQEDPFRNNSSYYCAFSKLFVTFISCMILIGFY